ncbi:MAG: ATP-binding protein, partial [Calditrichaceae bacterium]
MENYEKLGSFYLGKKYDSQQKKITDELVLYDSKDLTTHAVSLGMTGSGKTGLCISLLEEAAIDSIPAIIIDPKGDMTNLLLTFPDLLPENFRPWIDESEAARKGLSPEKFAEKQAELWKNGLAGWGEDGERIQRLKNSADYSIYTPGSSAGMPVSILKSFDAPPAEIRDELETFQERISTTVTSLLGLLGIDADPVKSREHILLSTILNHFWGNGKDLTLPDLIQSVQNPPVSQIGVFNVDSFYPAKERFELAMQMNNLLASPAFQTWLEGDAMDVQQFLYTESGKPRVSIFYIAHLSDAERMFFVSMLLNQFIGWMRTQSGTGSLRALLYIDELYGYMPPVSNPPSKKPLLTLLKQARAFGVGVVVATQNPVDLDYKGLSNTGTWFLGRLQTERDRDRVLDGLAGVTAAGGG